MIVIPNHRTVMYNNFFTTRLWNSLPNYLKSKGSRHQFAKSLKMHYINDIDEKQSLIGISVETAFFFFFLFIQHI